MNSTADITSIQLTPTEHRILHTLADGKPHKAEDLMWCLSDNLGSGNTLRVHLSNLRKKLQKLGQDLISQNTAAGPMYRRVIILSPECVGT